jgi:hypothetical protein
MLHTSLLTQSVSGFAKASMATSATDFPPRFATMNTSRENNKWHHKNGQYLRHASIAIKRPVPLHSRIV